MEGVLVRDYGQPIKRYVQILDLKDDDQLIEAYIKQHSKPHMWREIIDGIKAVGILVAIDFSSLFQVDVGRVVALF